MAAWASTSAHADNAGSTGTVSGTIEVRKGGGTRSNRGGVVVYLKSVPGGKARKQTATMRQKDRKFLPSVLVIVKGTSVEFPNDDRVAHNVFSNSRAATFDLGEYKRGKSKSKKFKRAGEVHVHCNIHPKMAATIKVVENRFYAITRRDGSFEIPDVPIGTYPIAAWLPNATEAQGTITVRAGQTSKKRIVVSEGQAPSRHYRKTGSPYGRY